MIGWDPPRLTDRDLAGVQVGDLLIDDIGADDVVAGLGEASVGVRSVDGYRDTATTVATVPITCSVRVRKVSQRNPSSSDFTGT